MKLRKICEEFVGGTNSMKQYFEIYKNPELKELRSIEKNYKRFIADFKNEAIYIFDANLLHQFAAEKLGIEKEYFYNDKNYAFSIAKGRNLPLITNYFSDIPSKIREEMKDGKHSWFFKYIRKE